MSTIANMPNIADDDAHSVASSEKQAKCTNKNSRYYCTKLAKTFEMFEAEKMTMKYPKHRVRILATKLVQRVNTEQICDNDTECSGSEKSADVAKKITAAMRKHTMLLMDVRYHTDKLFNILMYASEFESNSKQYPTAKVHASATNLVKALQKENAFLDAENDKEQKKKDKKRAREEEKVAEKERMNVLGPEIKAALNKRVKLIMNAAVDELEKLSKDTTPSLDERFALTNEVCAKMMVEPLVPPTVAKTAPKIDCDSDSDDEPLSERAVKLTNVPEPLPPALSRQPTTITAA